MPARAISPVIGVVILVAITVALAGVVLAVGMSTTPPASPPTATVDGSVDPAENKLSLVHTGGDPLPLEEISIRITVDGTPLAHQPPVPYYNPTGFTGFPSGVFNPMSDDVWEAGERGTITIDGDENRPLPTPDATVEVTIVADGVTVTRTTIHPA